MMAAIWLHNRDMKERERESKLWLGVPIKMNEEREVIAIDQMAKVFCDEMIKNSLVSTQKWRSSPFCEDKIEQKFVSTPKTNKFRLKHKSQNINPSLNYRFILFHL